MVQMPALCTQCGNAFQVQGLFSVSGSIEGLVMEGNFVNCPRCGGTARFIEGEMTVQAGAITLNSGPQWSYDLILALRLALVTTIEQEPADPIAPIENVSPEIGGRLRRVTSGWSRDQKLALLAILLALLPYFGVTPDNTQDAAANVWDSISDLLDRAEHDGSPPAAPQPDPPQPKPH